MDRFKEFLKSLGYTDEQITAVVNGMKEQKIYLSNEENIDERYTKLKGKYETQKTELKKANDTITDLKENAVDNEEVQNKLTKYETEIEKLKDEAAKKDFNYRLEDALKSSKAKNLKALKALLDMDKVKLEGDKFTGLEEQLTALKESDAYLFDAEEQQPPQLGGFKPTNTGGAPKGITKEQFHKMSYSERVELYNAQPEVYKQLTQ